MIDIKKVFVQFLEDNDCKEEFETTLEAGIGDTFQQHLEDPMTSTCDLISTAFDWEASKSGYEFWSGVDVKWYRALEELGHV